MNCTDKTSQIFLFLLSETLSSENSQYWSLLHFQYAFESICIWECCGWKSGPCAQHVLYYLATYAINQGLSLIICGEYQFNLRMMNVTFLFKGKLKCWSLKALVATFCFFFLKCVVLGIKPKPPLNASKCSPTELQPQLCVC